jgi:hypothetical protein
MRVVPYPISRGRHSTRQPRLHICARFSAGLVDDFVEPAIVDVRAIPRFYVAVEFL